MTTPDSFAHLHVRKIIAASEKNPQGILTDENKFYVYWELEDVFGKNAPVRYSWYGIPTRERCLIIHKKDVSPGTVTLIESHIKDVKSSSGTYYFDALTVDDRHLAFGNTLIGLDGATGGGISYFTGETVPPIPSKSHWWPRCYIL